MGEGAPAVVTKSLTSFKAFHGGWEKEKGGLARKRYYERIETDIGA